MVENNTFLHVIKSFYYFYCSIERKKKEADV